MNFEKAATYPLYRDFDDRPVTLSQLASLTGDLIISLNGMSTVLDVLLLNYNMQPEVSDPLDFIRLAVKQAAEVLEQKILPDAVYTEAELIKSGRLLEEGAQ